MEENKNIKHIRTFYRLLQVMIIFICKILYRFSWEGVEHIPETGGVIIASNHASYIDPPAIGAILPREVGFFAKKELCSIPLIGQLITYSNSIPVDRYGYNASAFREMIRRLKKGKAIIIFPEGTRTKTGRLGKVKTGVGMAAVIADVPVVPCLIEGSFSAKPFISKITINFMPSFKPCEIEAQTKKDHYLLVSERIMYDIRKLIEKCGQYQ